MELKKKRVVDELLNQDCRGTSRKEPRESGPKDCECRCCPQHSPPKPELKPMPCGHRMGGRNLIVCIDGTANQFGEKNTNVIELYNLVLKELGDNQRTWYNSGIGTYAKPRWKSVVYWKQVLFHIIDMIIAWDFERTVQGAYRWLSDNYEDGDCIFLFGFSRGAFQVRALSAMIDRVGLIHKGNEMQIPFAYELYAESDEDHDKAAPVGSAHSQAAPDHAAPTGWIQILLSVVAALLFSLFRWAPQKGESVAQDQPASEEPTREYVSKAERFKRAFSRKGVKVHFVGAWDTVSSIGMVRGKKMLPGTTNGMRHVCHFRHALALDERRVKFLPEYAWGGSTMPPSQPSHWNHYPPLSGLQSTDGDKHPHTLEVWFAGTHSDIGGGNVQNLGMDRSRPPLRWMVSEAVALGLRTAEFERELRPDQQIEFQESLTGVWHLLEYWPVQRLTFHRNPGGKMITQTPHRGGSRNIHWGQKIHSSLILAETPRPYIPKARPPPGNGDQFWHQLRAEGLSNPSKWLEIDIVDYTRRILRQFAEGKEVDDILKRIAASGIGAQAVYDEVIENMSHWDGDSPSVAIKYQLVHTAVDILGEHLADLKLQKWRRIGSVLGSLSRSGSDEDRAVVEVFLQRYTKDVNCLFKLHGHECPVPSVAISPDGRRIVSGSWDNTIRIWNAETGAQVGEPLRGHEDAINSVAISPDGKFIVSGSDDNTIRIWDAETGMQVGESLQGHEDLVMSVAISPDGKRIISSSGGCTIRIWDAERGTQVGELLEEHHGCVNSIAISPDSKRVISGSDEKTIRIWDAETGTQLGESLRGHTDYVRSVAISPDGKHIVSRSDDKTIWIWDAETGAQVGEPLQGHTNYVLSVAISPDGKRIVSGSDDGTIRIWYWETRAQVGEPLQGHTGIVWSVAVSPDGKRIVSGSSDGTVRIWNAEGILV